MEFHMNVDNNENFLDDDGQANHEQQLNEDMNQELQEDSQNPKRVFGPKYWYGRGPTYFLNLNYRF